MLWIIILTLILLGCGAYFWFSKKSTPPAKIDQYNNQTPLIAPVKTYQQNIESKAKKFIPSSKWIGKKHGYVFKSGSRGQGYYKDVRVRFSDTEIINYDPGESPVETGDRTR